MLASCCFWARRFLQARSFTSTPQINLGRRALNGALSLDLFLQRSRTLALYRTVIRGTRRIADPKARAETKRFARDEFERHRGVTDVNHIRYLLSTGKTEWESMERYIDGL